VVAVTFAQLRDGLAIFARYVSDDDAVCAEHDELFVCSVPPKNMAESDRIALAGLGWRWSDVNSWRHFT
jgi:hypothetical protein